jgi:hypothetical protein
MILAGEPLGNGLPLDRPPRLDGTPPKLEGIALGRAFDADGAGMPEPKYFDVAGGTMGLAGDEEGTRISLSGEERAPEVKVSPPLPPVRLFLRPSRSSCFVSFDAEQTGCWLTRRFSAPDMVWIVVKTTRLQYRHAGYSSRLRLDMDKRWRGKSKISSTRFN